MSNICDADIDHAENDDGGSNLDDLEVLYRLNGDVELDEAIGSSWTQLFVVVRSTQPPILPDSWTQLFAVNTPRGTDDSSLFVDVEPEVTAATVAATVRCCIHTRWRIISFSTFISKRNLTKMFSVVIISHFIFLQYLTQTDTFITRCKNAYI